MFKPTVLSRTQPRPNVSENIAYPLHDPKGPDASPPIPERLRLIDRDTLFALKDIAVGIFQVMQALPGHAAFNSLADQNDALVAIIGEGLEGVIL